LNYYHDYYYWTEVNINLKFLQEKEQHALSIVLLEIIKPFIKFPSYKLEEIPAASENLNPCNGLNPSQISKEFPFSSFF